MKKKGRPCKYTAEQIRTWRQQIMDGKTTVTKIARQLGKNPGTVHQTLYGAGRYEWVK